MFLIGFKNFRLNAFTFTVNNLEILFQYLVVTRPTYYYIIIIMRITLDGFTVSNAKGSITSAKKYFVIKRILFMFKKKFITTNNKKRHY